MRNLRMNVARLVSDMGGAAVVARYIGKSRTTPYSWIRSGYISSENLALLKSARPDIDIDEYFEPVEVARDEGDRSEGA